MRKSPMEFGALVARAQDDARRDGPIVREVADQLFAEPYSRHAEKRIRARRRVTFAAALSAACAAAVLVTYSATRPVPLGITLDGTTVERPMGMFVEAAPSEKKPLRFTDGSRVVLAPSAAARIVDTSEDGASVLVERGEVEVSVVHRDDTRWRFDVGPYTVRVTGTAFVVSWRPDTGLFSLTLGEGSVEVAGPALVKSRSVVAGETLKAWPRERKVMLVSNDRGRDTSPSQTERGAVRAPTPVLAIDTLVGDAVPFAAEPTVTEVVKAPTETESPEPIAEKAPSPFINKKISPILTVPEDIGPNDLLKQAARERAAGDFERAKQTYAVLRSGFPKTQAAADAAFSLGRIAFDVDRDFVAAIDWFQTFLLEYRGHALKREAMGRLMESYVKAARRSDAIDSAERYLSRYPDGPHAPLARSIIGE